MSYFTRISRYITLYIKRLVLSVVSRNRGRSWNVSPADTEVHLYVMYALAHKAPLSGPQNQHFNCTMRPTTLHKTYRTYIHFLKIVVSSRGGQQRQQVNAVGRGMFFIGPIRRFVFDILLKPSNCVQICRRCIAASCDHLTTGLVTLY